MAFDSFHFGGLTIRPIRSLLAVFALIGSIGAPALAVEEESATGGDEYPVEADPSYETVVQGYRIDETDETTGFAESMAVSDKTDRMVALGEVLSEAVGIHVRSLGGPGAYGEVSIRGSSPNQVPVLLDGVELNAGGAPSVDIGAFTLDVFESVEVYRGSAPLALGVSNIGGAISLKTRTPKDHLSTGAVSYGSLSTGRLFLLESARMGQWRGLVLLSAQGSKGDFAYLNRNGTLQDTSDDRIVRRRNNRHQSIGNLVKLDGPLRDWHLTVANDIFAQERGVPGIESVPTDTASQNLLRETLSLKLDRRLADRVDLQLDASYSGLKEDFRKSVLEFNQVSDVILSATHSPAMSVLCGIDWNASHHTAIRVGNRVEVFSHEERAAGVPIPSLPMRRVRTAMGVAHEWRPILALTLSPKFSTELHQSRFPGAADPTGDGALTAKSRDAVYWSPALGAKWEVRSGLFLRANGGRYIRPPSMGELFGYSGTVRGNPDLKEEVGVNWDAGITYMLENRGALSSFRIDAAGFGASSHDLIVYEQSSMEEVRPENVSRALMTGAEAAVRLLLMQVLAFEANYTYLFGVNRSDTPYYFGRRLPGRPAHEAYARIEARDTFGEIGSGLWLDADLVGHIYLKQANQGEHTVPMRMLLGCGYRLTHAKSHLGATLEVKNMMNRISFPNLLGDKAPMGDYVGFPLPGRTIIATLFWKV